VAGLDEGERFPLCQPQALAAAFEGAGLQQVQVAPIEIDLVFADFDDYSDVAVMPDAEGTHRIAVLSQETSALWLGSLTTKPLAIVGPGVVYGFPRAAGEVQYCSLEGVTFMDRTTLAMASDRAKTERCNTKAEALHVFRLP